MGFMNRLVPRHWSFANNLVSARVMWRSSAARQALCSAKKVGTSGCVDTAKSIYDGLMSVFAEKGIYLAAQCCEHLNRAIIIESEKAKELGLERVCVVPYPHAGGSFATTAYHSMKSPVAVEEIKADAGIDIGGTLIGMHLKRVAVPLKLEHKEIGCARLTAARTRPKFIGGERAKYE